MAHIRLHQEQANGHLPMVCMRCGEPATVLRTKTMSWYPRWIFVFIFFGGLLIVAILAVVLRKRARVQAPFCDDHQGHWSTRTALMWAASLVAVAVGVGCFAIMIAVESMQPRPAHADDVVGISCLGGSLFFLAWLITLAIIQSTAIRPDEITRTHILLNGVSEEFVTAVEEMEIERRLRLRQWQDEGDWPEAQAADAPPARPKPPSSDAIEEPRRRPPALPPDAFEA